MSTARAWLRLGIIGAGTITQAVHLGSVRRSPFELVAVCDISPSRVAAVAASNGVLGTTNPDQLLAMPEVDAVIIATTGSHAVLARAALEAGKHVLAEKPLAVTIAEVDALETLAARQGLVAQVGYMKMHDPLTARARRELGELVDVRLVRVTVLHPDDAPQLAHLRMPAPPRDADPSVIEAAEDYERAQGQVALPGAPAALVQYYLNVLNGSVLHELSLLRALGIDAPTRWAAEAFPALGDRAPASLLATGAVGDARIVLSWNWLPEFPEYEEELTVLASNGRVQYQLARPYLLEARSALLVDRGVGTERRSTTYTEIAETGFLRQLDAFAASIRNAAPVAADLAGARSDLIRLQGLAAAIGRGHGWEGTTEAALRHLV